MNEVHFLKPGEDNSIILDIIKSRMDHANIVRMAVSYFTHYDIASYIIDRIDQGYKTQIILNAQDMFRPERNGESELKVSGALLSIINKLKTKKWYDGCQIKTLGLEQKHSVMHHKFLISGNVDVCYGSMNYTRNSIVNNYENFSIIREQSIVDAFIDEFESLWQVASDLYIGADGIRSFKCPKCGSEGGVDFESYGAFCTICELNFRMTDV